MGEPGERASSDGVGVRQRAVVALAHPADQGFMAASGVKKKHVHRGVIGESHAGDTVRTLPEASGPMLELPDIAAALLMILTVAVFAAMIWAGSHSH